MTHTEVTQFWNSLARTLYDRWEMYANYLKVGLPTGLK